MGLVPSGVDVAFTGRSADYRIHELRWCGYRETMSSAVSSPGPPTVWLTGKPPCSRAGTRG